jgi:hypothetical protein
MKIHHDFPDFLDEIVEEAVKRNVCDARRIADWNDEGEHLAGAEPDRLGIRFSGGFLSEIQAFLDEVQKALGEKFLCWVEKGPRGVNLWVEEVSE